MQRIISVSHLTGLTPSVFLSLLMALMLFTLILKGYALWYSARGEQKWWFIVLLVINTMGILDIVYLLFFSPNPIIDTTKSALKKDSAHGSESTE